MLALRLRKSGTLGSWPKGSAEGAEAICEARNGLGCVAEAIEP